jgi:hypothetical protein
MRFKPILWIPQYGSRTLCYDVEYCGLQQYSQWNGSLFNNTIGHENTSSGAQALFVILRSSQHANGFSPFLLNTSG